MLYTNYFIEALKKYLPSDIVLFEGKQSITAGQLFDSAQQLATSLLENGVNKGDKVIIVVKPSIEFLQVMYANMMLGTIIAIIDPEMGRENYLAKLKQFSPHHAFVDSKLVFLNEHPLLKFAVLKWNKSVPSFPKLKNCHLFTTGIALPLFQKHKHISSLIKNTMRPFTTEMIKEEEEFLITYTSGTLSEPKGVVHTYSSITNSIKHLTAVLQNNKDEIIATHLPHYALLGINAGIKVHLWNNRMSASEKIAFMLKEKITILFGPPSDFIPLIAYLKQYHAVFPKSLKNIYLGSAPIYNSFLSMLVPLAEQVKITCFYGMTENLMVTFQDGRNKMLEELEGDLVGFPFPHVNISIAEDGEICIHSDQLYAHYWQMEKIKSVHHTGDIGRVDEQGRLILMGRKKI
ncbi:MAG: acyl--CoA ligase [Saprospiraceae bacterium]|nr:acyl--CoA ligase [Saprospiraceae bacterium]